MLSRDSGSSLLMFVMGAAVGAAATALYMPITGPALRRRFSQAAEDGAEMATDAIDGAGAFVRERAQAAGSIVNRAGDAFQKARAEAVHAAE